jgi:hypothetical protein
MQCIESLQRQRIPVANNKHRDHEFRIDRRAADLAEKGLQLLVEVGESGGHNTFIRRSKWFFGITSSSLNS